MVIKMKESNIVVSAVLGADSISATADRLSAGQYIRLEENNIMSNKQLTLSFRTEGFSDGDTVRVGHGEELYCSCYLELTSQDIKIYEIINGPVLLAERAHGLTIKDSVSLSIDVGYSSASVTLASGGGVYQSGVMNRCWSGWNGGIFAVSKSSEITDVKMRWCCEDYAKCIWMFGDSYFNPKSEYRWTSYLLKDGYSKYLLSAFPGRNTASALIDFKQALTHGTPKFAVWCMGMNDSDWDAPINTSYKRCTDEFLAICENKGITPILATIPCVPARDHSGKNAWIKASGHRYVDFAMAVGGETRGSGWYDGMLSADEVHPDVLGAKALYAQFLTDFPEIMKKN